MRRAVVLLAAVVGVLALAAEPEGASLPELKGEAKARIQNLEQDLNDWDLEAAKVELAELAKLAPADSAPLAYYEGRVAFEDGRYDDAAERFTKAGISDKTDTWLRLTKQTREVVGKHEKVESAHFVFEFPKGRDAVLAAWGLDALETVRTALEKDLGYAPPGKVRVEIVGNAADLSKVSTLSKEAIRTTGTIAICKFNKLMVTSPRATLKGYDWLDTVAHEYVHLVVSRKSRNTVPIWMHEGLAKYLESRWRGPAGGAMTPSTLALLGNRVKKNTLVPFEKMHPSMALLPTAEDAATAFAEVFFAIEMIHKEQGPESLARMLDAMSKGASDRAAVEAVTKKKWPEFERAWMAHLKRQPFPRELIPVSSNEKKELTENQDPKKKKSAREVSFGDFAELTETDARRSAHVGELLRERKRMPAAAEAYARAWKQVGDKYESVSNKYALTLLELKQYTEAEQVLEGSLTMHPGSASTNVHLGRIRLRAKAWARAKTAYLDALAVNPFDPEVHVALYATAQATKDTKLMERAQNAAATLLKLDATVVPELARRFASAEDLASVDVTQAPHSMPAPPDAG